MFKKMISSTFVLMLASQISFATVTKEDVETFAQNISLALINGEKCDATLGNIQFKLDELGEIAIEESSEATVNRTLIIIAGAVGAVALVAGGVITATYYRSKMQDLKKYSVYEEYEIVDTYLDTLAKNPQSFTIEHRNKTMEALVSSQKKMKTIGEKVEELFKKAQSTLKQINTDN